MAIAQTLIDYLEARGVTYSTVEHPHSATARESARSAHVPAHQVAKAVVLKDDTGFVVSVLPANHTLEIDWVNQELERSLALASETEFKELFKDCELGAVPALSDAYGIQVIWDDDLQYTADIYIEAGDHEHLICLERKDFKKLMSSLPHSVISKDREVGHWKY
jgi:Ala-tRNA(Pro) deacylase